MSKVLIFSDIHVHTHKQSLTRLNHCLETLEWVFKTAVERNITDILFLGDLFQDRQKIQVLTYHKTYAIIKRFAEQGLRIFMLVGNHDMWYDNQTDISSVFPFDAIHNVTVIDKPRQLMIAEHPVDFLPYTKNPLESIKQYKTKPARILCGHIAIDGAQLNTLHKIASEVSVELEGDMVKVSSSEFARWEKVFLGHYHGSQVIDHIEYVGSPLQLNYAEAFQQKHIIVFDLENLSCEYIVNDFSPKHLIIDQDEISEYNLNNSFVRMRPNDITSVDLIDLQNKLMREHSILNIEFSAPSEKKEERQVEDAKNILMSNGEEKFVKYMESMGHNGLDKDILMDVVREIIQLSSAE